jgi:hypothetical protein
MKDKSLPKQAHKAMHRIPGVPEHGQAKHLNSHRGLPNRSLKNRSLQGVRLNHPNREPKVLIGWQQRVAKFFGVEIK